MKVLTIPCQYHLCHLVNLWGLLLRPHTYIYGFQYIPHFHGLSYTSFTPATQPEGVEGVHATPFRQCFISIRYTNSTKRVLFRQILHCFIEVDIQISLALHIMPTSIISWDTSTGARLVWHSQYEYIIILKGHLCFLLFIYNTKFASNKKSANLSHQMTVVALIGVTFF